MKARRQSGFSLIELAVVLVIVGLLVGGGIAALEATRTQTLRSDQKRQLERVREALYGFAQAEGRLPCPDGPDDDASEDFDGDDCDSSIVSNSAARGRLPSADLGLGHSDAWGYPLHYVVTAEYADAPDASESESTDESSFVLGSDGNLAVHEDHNASPSTTLADEVPAVVVSFGPQGGQVWTSSGFTCPGDGSPVDGFSENETENCGDAPNQFVDAGFSRSDTMAGRFDDMLIWLSDPVLKSRMVQAGKLP